MQRTGRVNGNEEPWKKDPRTHVTWVVKRFTRTKARAWGDQALRHHRSTLDAANVALPSCMHFGWPSRPVKASAHARLANASPSIIAPRRPEGYSQPIICLALRVRQKASFGRHIILPRFVLSRERNEA
jgi:hypothetical protein